MAVSVVTPDSAGVQFRVCTNCCERKPTADFGHTTTSAGKSILRAQCRSCYNLRRRSQYACPDIKREFRRKRKLYESRIGLSEKRKIQRANPKFRDKEKSARDLYRAKPAVKERLKAYRRSYVSSPEKRALYLFGSVKLRAQKKNLPFDLTLDWVTDRVLSNKCALTGLSFDCAPPPNGWAYNPLGPSIDQIAAGGGYTMENCRVVITAINNALSQYGEHFFEEVAAAFLKQRGFIVSKD